MGVEDLQAGKQQEEQGDRPDPVGQPRPARLPVDQRSRPWRLGDVSVPDRGLAPGERIALFCASLVARSRRGLFQIIVLLPIRRTSAEAMFHADHVNLLSAGVPRLDGEIDGSGDDDRVEEERQDRMDKHESGAYAWS